MVCVRSFLPFEAEYCVSAFFLKSDTQRSARDLKPSAWCVGPGEVTARSQVLCRDGRGEKPRAEETGGAGSSLQVGVRL